MAAALKARGGASLGAATAAPKASAVLEAAERTVQGLRAIPVLDVALLPKPKPKEDDEDGEKGPDPAEKPKARKGRPTGTANKRASQSSLQAGAAAGIGGEGDAAAANPPAKRQRTLTPAAAALAADAKRKTTAAAAAATAATTPTAAGGGVSTPLAGSAPSAAQALPPGGPLDDGRGAVNLPRWDSDGRNPISIARVGSSSGPMQGDGRSLARPSSNATAALSGGVPMVSADGAGVSSLPAAVLSARDRATSAAASLPPGLAKPVRAPPPGSAPLPPVPLPLSESPSTSLDGRGALGTSGGGAGVLAPTSSGGAAGAAAAAAAGRVSVAEIKARFQEVKAQNATLASELDAAKRAVAAAEAAKAQTAALLQARNAEVDQLLAALDERTKQAAALGERLAAREAEVAALTAANARLQQELDQLNDIDLE
ncbi:hypothetical protein HYH03_018417 [Edaphochlamys debaryana]|uniref:Uncharacterized protein n=1 Tax=Edaphochlamys debaryana TaxID=47281 RepID=A0A835XLZ2_9CHLO|nr:hypothetical protein HYH03_018417 [Edaphochlamys debaryana]|eukprot:KAG2482644.1 hypothetical protein HYH03_018417 [Edaphochlamys debaryana]